VPSEAGRFDVVELVERVLELLGFDESPLEHAVIATMLRTAQLMTDRRCVRPTITSKGNNDKRAGDIGK
jgi:hypothetical protein